MKRKNDFIIGIVVAVVTLFLILIIISINSKKSSTDFINISSGGKKVGVINLNGIIYNSRSIIKDIEFYQQNSSIKAVILRIDSPGGVIGASQEIYNAVKRVRESGKPIIVSMGNVAASGAYYISCGADTIVANPGTTTGSIGVIAEFINLKELLNNVGITFQIIKSGRFKDTGSPYRDLNEADRRYLQSWVDDAFEQFVDIVTEERKLSRNAVIQIADGRVFTGKQALENGLIDILGDYQTAVDFAAELGGIEGKPVIVRKREYEVSLFDLLFQKIEGILRISNGVIIKYSM
ncbi:MAG: signal peptide peptidase SppA [bacterium]